MVQACIDLVNGIQKLYKCVQTVYSSVYLPALIVNTVIT